MRSRLLSAALAVLAPSLAACGSGSSTTSRSGSRTSHLSRPTQIYRVRLSGADETPPAPPHGTGVAIIAFHGSSKVCWRFAHLHGFTNATMAHINAGAKGRSGAIVVGLSTTAHFHHQGCAAISPVLSREIWSKPSQYYVNIRSTLYPGGAVRAQL
jgi:CHRD domain-containing protein